MRIRCQGLLSGRPRQVRMKPDTTCNRQTDQSDYLATGARLAQSEIVEPIGSGGMGEVYRHAIAARPRRRHQGHGAARGGRSGNAPPLRVPRRGPSPPSHIRASSRFTSWPSSTTRRSRSWSCSKERRCAARLKRARSRGATRSRSRRQIADGLAAAHDARHHPPRSQAGERVPHCDGASRFSTSGWRCSVSSAAPRRRWPDDGPTRRASSWARSATCRPSRSAAIASTGAPTSSRSAACWTEMLSGRGSLLAARRRRSSRD